MLKHDAKLSLPLFDVPQVKRSNGEGAHKPWRGRRRRFTSMSRMGLAGMQMVMKNKSSCQSTGLSTMLILRFHQPPPRSWQIPAPGCEHPPAL